METRFYGLKGKEMVSKIMFEIAILELPFFETIREDVVFNVRNMKKVETENRDRLQMLGCKITGTFQNKVAVQTKSDCKV